MRTPVPTRRTFSFIMLCATALSVFTAAPVFGFGPFPAGTTVFVDASNSGLETGTAAQPFNTIYEAVAVAAPGAVVGVAPGVYEDGANITQPLTVLGFDAKTTVVQSPGIDTDWTAFHIDSANVRVSGFTLTGSFEPDDPDTENIYISKADGSIRVDHNIIQGNCDGIKVFDYVGTGHPLIDSNVIRGNVCAGIWGHSAHIVNNLIENNGAAAIAALERLPVSIVNNTLAGNGVGIGLLQQIPVPAPPSDPGVIRNNIIAGNDTFGVVFSEQTGARPALQNNLFYDNQNGHLRDGAVTLNTQNGINAIVANSGNRIGDPLFFAAAGHNFHLSGNSPAIDRGLNAGAPEQDLDASPRPVDGDGDCKKVTDIGAYEVPAGSPALAQLGRCTKYLLLQPQQWVKSGCAIVDCCPFCPGLNILEWIVSVQGAPIKTLVLRFGNLSPEAAAALEWEGEAEWIGPERLLVLGDAIQLHSIPFPTAEELERGTAVTVTAESVSSERSLIGSTVHLNLLQIVNGAVIAEHAFDYEIRENQCPGCAARGRGASISQPVGGGHIPKGLTD